MREIRNGSPELRAAAAAARSAQNLKTRKANEREESIAENARRRRKRISDQEAEAFIRRRVRVRAAPEDRPRGSNRTPRKLTNRTIKDVYTGSWGNSPRCASDGMSSIHFDFVPRGFGSKKGRSWRSGEAERASLYMTAHESLEDGELGWHSNVADDRNELRTFWRVIEAVERHDRANANVYIAEVIELPCEASPRLRRRIVKRIVERLTKRGLAYVAAIHKPDRGGDQRNFHLHLMYSLRPSERIAAHEWEFGMSKVADINTKDGIKERRRSVVRDINATLNAAHIAKRYTALSNGARGLEPSTQTKVGQKRTWAKRRLLAAQQKVDEIHRLLAMAADLRATTERVQQTLKEAKQRVTSELGRKAQEIVERGGQRAKLISELAARVELARSALVIRQHGARISAASNEMYAASIPVLPIAEIPRNSESSKERINISVASELAQARTDASPETVKRAPIQSPQDKDIRPGGDATSHPRVANVSSESEKAPEDSRLASARERAQAPHHPTPVKKASGQEQKAVVVRKNDSAVAKHDALQPPSKAATVTAQAGNEKPLASAAQKFVSLRKGATKDNEWPRHHSTVSVTKSEKDKPHFARKANITDDGKSSSQSVHPKAGSEKPLSREDLAEIARQKLEARAGVKRADNLNVGRARQAAIAQAQAVAERKKALMARPADDLSPMVSSQPKPPLAQTQAKTIAQSSRTSQMSSEPEGLDGEEGRSNSGAPDRKQAAEPPDPSHNEPGATPTAKGVPPERVFSRGRVSSTEEGWQPPTKGHER